MVGSELKATGLGEAEDTEVALEPPSDGVDTGVALGAPFDEEMTLEELLADVELETPFYVKKGKLD